jgi:hypothetical protein
VVLYLQERVLLKDIGIGGKIILKMILRISVGWFELDSFG